MAKKLHLNNDFCDRVTYSSNVQVYKDDQVIGFGLRVRPTSKTFILEMKHEGKKVRVTIGPFPDLSTGVARKKARTKRAEIIQGVNPNAEKKKRIAKKKSEEAITLESVWKEYSETKTLADKTKREYERLINSENLLKPWKNLPLNQINRIMVRKKYKQIKSFSPAQANHSFRLLRALYNFTRGIDLDSEFQAIIKDNPVQILSSLSLWEKIEPRKELIEVENLKSFWKALEGYKGRRRMDFIFFVKLVLFTGLRLNEARLMRWENIDLEKGFFTIRKTKNKLDHILPFGNYLDSLFKERTTQAGVYLFPGAKGGAACDFRNEILVLSNQYGKNIRIHDLRRTFATLGKKVLGDEILIKRLMNHKIKDITQDYIIKNYEELRQPMQKIESFVLAKVNEIDSHVLPFKKNQG